MNKIKLFPKKQLGKSSKKEKEIYKTEVELKNLSVFLKSDVLNF